MKPILVAISGLMFASAAHAASDIDLCHSRDLQARIDACTRLIKLNPTDPDLYSWRGAAYRIRALDWKRKVNWHDVVVDPAMAKRALTDHTMAIELITSGKATGRVEDWDLTGEYLSRANIYHALEEYEKAIVDCNAWIAAEVAEGNKKPIHIPYKMRGMVYMSMGIYKQATADLTRALAGANQSRTVTDGYYRELKENLAAAESLLKRNSR